MGFGVVEFLNNVVCPFASNVVCITFFPNLEMGDMASVNVYDCFYDVNCFT